MAYTIAMAGKGGTGKTTIAALLVRLLKEEKRGSILAVDADPNSNLAEALGIQCEETIGNILDKLAADPQKVPAGMTKERFLEYEVQTAVAEGEGFDLLTMGRPEGPGCYCYVNNVLRSAMSKLINDYDYVIIDNEAGLEHLSRRTSRSADALIVVSDAAIPGLRAAKRIVVLIDELGIKIGKRYLIVNRSENFEKEKLAGLNIEYLGLIPADTNIENISLNGGSLMDLKNDSSSLQVLRRLGGKLWQSN